MTAFPFPETFTILTQVKSGTSDSYGNDVFTAASVSTTGAFAPEGSTELIQGQATVLDHDTIYLSDDAPVPGPKDKIVVRGATYQIDGTPAVFQNVWTGGQPGAVLRLLKVTG